MGQVSSVFKGAPAGGGGTGCQMRPLVARCLFPASVGQQTYSVTWPTKLIKGLRQPAVLFKWAPVGVGEHCVLAGCCHGTASHKHLLHVPCLLLQNNTQLGFFFFKKEDAEAIIAKVGGMRLRCLVVSGLRW